MVVYQYVIKKNMKNPKICCKNYFPTPNVLINIDSFNNALIDNHFDIDIFRNGLIDIDIFRNRLFDIDIDIFKKC